MKKLNKLFAILVAMAMVLSLSVISAFAANPMADKTDKSTVYLSKVLKIAEGIAAPDETFTFKVDPKTVDGNPYVPATTGENATPANMPSLTAGTVNMKNATATDGDIIKTVTIDTNVAYPHNGVYVYEVTENVPTTGANEDITYDVNHNKYTLTVAKSDEGVIVTVQDANNPNAPKLDVSKPTDDDPNDEDDGLSPMAFTNAYTKTASGTTTTDGKSASFLVDKDTTGKYADTTKEFDFKIEITYPATGDHSSVAYYKYDNSSTATEKSTAIPAEKISTDETTGVVTVTVTLADEDQFFVTGAPVGTKYTVTETLPTTDAAAQKYTSTATLTEENKKGEDQAAKVTNSAQGTGAVVTNALVYETAQNKAEFVNANTKDAGDNDPGTTGILVSNLPYLPLALVARRSLATYVVIRPKADDAA